MRNEIRSESGNSNEIDRKNWKEGFEKRKDREVVEDQLAESEVVNKKCLLGR